MRWLGRFLGVALTLSISAGGCAHDVDYELNATYDVLIIDVDAKSIEIAGDRTLDFFEGETVEITQSSKYNGKFTVVTLAVVEGNTQLTVEEDLPVVPQEITAVDPAAGYFELTGNVTTSFSSVTTVDVLGSSQNEGRYTLADVVLEGENTRLFVDDPIPGDSAGGTVQPADYGVLRHGEADQLTPDPTSVRLRFVTVDNLSPSFWYYMIFNFTKAPANFNTVVPEEDRPLDEISGADRAQNWELYVVVHVDGGGGEEVLTLQRSRYPTVLNTGLGPADVTSGYLNDGNTYQDGQLIDIENNVIDLAVACELDNKVQLISGVKPDDKIKEPVFYMDAVDIQASRGSGLIAPIRVFAGELTGDQITDLLILYAGDGDAVAGALRVLAGDGTGGFSEYRPNTTISGTALDWVDADFNDDGLLDVAILTTAESGNQVQLYLRQDIAEEGAEVPIYDFAAGGALDVGDNPLGLAAGDLQDGSGLDLLVADTGGEIDGEGDDDIDKLRLFVNDGTATFTAGPVLPVEGQLTGVNIGVLHGSSPDIVVSYFNIEEGSRAEDEQGNALGSVAAYLIEGDVNDIGETVPTVTFAADPRYLLVHNTSGIQGSYPSVVVVDGQTGTGPGDTHQTMYILRTGRDQGELTWNSELITYLTGANEPSRIHLADFNSDGAATDFAIVNSADNDGGSRVSLFYSLGRTRPADSTGVFYDETQHNYSNADSYWTDDQPQQLVAQEWYLNHTVGPNFFELVVDPVLFYDLARLPPESFIVDFMTGTTAIEFDLNELQLGIIRERLTEPVVVPVEVNFSNYEQISPRALTPIDDPAADIIDWIVEVL